MAWHNCKLWINGLFCLHSEVFHWSCFTWVKFGHRKEQCPKPRYYLLSGCIEWILWGEIFFKVLEFIGLIHCFVRLDIDLWKLFEHEAVEMIFFALIIFLEGVSVSQIYGNVSMVINICQEEKQMLFFSVAAELKSVLTFLFTACHPRNRLFRRSLVFFQVIWSVNCHILLIFLSWGNGI